MEHGQSIIFTEYQPVPSSRSVCCFLWINIYIRKLYSISIGQSFCQSNHIKVTQWSCCTKFICDVANLQTNIPWVIVSMPYGVLSLTKQPVFWCFISSTLHRNQQAQSKMYLVSTSNYYNSITTKPTQWSSCTRDFCGTAVRAVSEQDDER